jgi:protocatechuate 3,4-dioxygenase beta subunit
VRDFQRTAKGLHGLILPARVRVQADEAGRFRIERLAPGIYDLVVTAEGMVPVTLYAVHAPAEDVEVLMREGLSVSGTVTWGGGDPPGGLTVRSDPFDRRGVLVAEEGKVRFAIEGLLEGPYDILARASGFAETRVRIELVRGSAAPSVDIRLAPGTTVAGKVTDHDTGRPIAGVLVSFTRAEEVLTTVTDENGLYRVGLTPGRWVASAERDGYLASQPSSSWSARHGRLGPGEIEVLDNPTERSFKLRARFTITGRVLYRDGGPASAFVQVTEAEVRTDVRYPPAKSPPRGKGSRTKKDGSFVIEGVVPWGSYTVRATAGPDNFAEVEDVVVPDGEQEVEIADLVVDHPPAGYGLEPEPPATVRGRVVDERGDPVVGAVVSIGGRPGTTGPDGRFEVPGVKPPSASVRVLAAGFAPTVFEGVDVRAGEVLVLRDLVLPREGVRVTGRILDSSARPIPGAAIRIRFAGSEGVFDTVSDDEGIFGIEGPSIPLVHISILAEAKGFLPGKVQEQVASERVIDVVLRRFASFSGTLTYRGERPETISVTFRPTWNKAQKAVIVDLLDDGRTFRCEEMQLGTFKLTIKASGYPPKDIGTHTFLEGKTTSLGAVAVGKGGSITGLVVRSRAHRNATFVVTIPALELKTSTDPAGRFHFENVPAGTHVIYLIRPNISRSARRVTVHEGKQAKVRFKYP